ncbi:PIG-L family deacetylase [Aquincola sp. S2]|uniref:PIG-L family deacetylase n=1 Tax=Pseudaquabacterium terrae TaxID=2732868 RepID=A0ABX2EDX3_9BURK|nr:PIG-L deacetylase family protein [Aquabacterium terrae]NRF66814.1 PIG-L family deacetylase [Aquabacterium terrae]
MNDALSPDWRPHAEPALVPYQPLRRLPVQSLLVLAPHPDDEVFGCGGLLALAAAQGVQARVVVISDGAAGGDRAVRENECRAAARILGHHAALQFWQLPDRAVRPDAALVERLRQAQAESAAEWVLAPSPFEVHPDHRAVCRAAVEACRGVAGSQLGFYEVGQPLLPNALVDITPVMPLKLRAMRCFESQLAVQDYASQIAALNHYRAYTLGAAVRQAEALCFVDAADLAGGLEGVLLAMQRELRRRFDAVDNPTP